MHILSMTTGYIIELPKSQLYLMSHTYSRSCMTQAESPNCSVALQLVARLSKQACGTTVVLIQYMLSDIKMVLSACFVMLIILHNYC